MSDRGFAASCVVAFGVSTPFSYWGFGVVTAIVEAMTGGCLHLHVSSLAQLRDGFQRRDGASVVVTSDFPDADLGEFIGDAGLPMIVFTDEPATVLQWTMESRGLDPASAARLCSRIYAALASPIKTNPKLIVRRGPASQDTVAAIVEFLWPGRDLAQKAHEHLASTGKLAPLPAKVEPADGEAPPLRAAMDALAGYADLLVGRWPDEVVWPLTFFTRLDERPWSDPIDLTGPARAVLYGPYMHLPAGEWVARVEFEIDGALSGLEAVTDVKINELVIEKTFKMPAKGIFAYELSFRVDDPHHAVEIRLFIKKSAIEGRFLPRSVRVSPRSRPSPG